MMSEMLEKWTHTGAVARVDLATGTRSEALLAVGAASSRASGEAAVLMISGCLNSGPDETSDWAKALGGIVGASQLTISVICGQPSADDGALLLLCDVVLFCSDADLSGWHVSLVPPSIAARPDGLAQWLAPQRWTPQRALALGYLTEIVEPDVLDKRVEEWIGVVLSWDRDSLAETRGLSRNLHGVTMVEVLAQWLDARARLQATDSD